MEEKILKVHELIGKSLAGLRQQYGPALQKLVEEAEFAEQSDNLLAQLAADYAPKAFGPDLLVKRTPYANPAEFATDFEGAVARGWLEEVGKGSYKATEKAITYYAGVVGKLNKVMGQLEGSLTVDLDRIRALVKELEEDAWETGALSTKSALKMTAEMEFSDDAPTLSWVWYHLANLSAYRDDCHMAAWQVHIKDGHEWEAFTFIKEEQAKTAAELAEKLPFRRYEEEAYAGALKSLVKRGWIEAVDGGFQATDEGRALRDLVESQTNTYYKSIFSAFSEEQVDELVDLLDLLADEVTPAQEEQPA